MKILLTGATGFIGSRLLSRISSDHEVIAVVRPGTTPPPGTETVEWDLREPLRSGVLPSKTDCIIHFGLPRNFKDFPTAADDVFQIVVRATMDLLRYARYSNVSQFVMASTGNMMAPDYSLAIGGRPVPPNDMYTASKIAAEALARPFRSCYPVCVLRLFFPYGSGQIDRTIPNLVKRIQSGQPVALAGGGDGDELSLIHVDDLTNIVSEALTAGWNGLFDVGAPEPVTVRRIAQHIGEALNTDPIFVASEEAPKRMLADLSKLEVVYEVARLRSFAEGIREIL